MTARIYLDNSSTTRPSDTVISKMVPFHTEMWGSLSAPHQMGQEQLFALEDSYKAIYALLGAKETDHFIFTSSGAEAINQAFFSTYLEVMRLTGKNQFIASSIEEAPILMSINRLEHLGCVGKIVTPDRYGRVTRDIIADSITPRTAMVSISWGNGLTGIINPVEEIAVLCKSRGIYLHIDATHILGKLAFDMSEIGAEFITFNGDHFHAPKGTGGLLVKEGIKIAPLIVGGIEQAGMRAGTVNMPDLAALGQAASEAIDSRDFVCTEVGRLRNKLETGILEGYPEAEVLFFDQERLPHCTTILFKGIVNEAMLYALNKRQVFASIGGGSFQQIGLVVKGCGVPEPLARTAVNFSLSRTTTEKEIERAIAIIVETAHRLQKASLHI